LIHSRLPEWPRKSELIEQLRRDRALDQPTRAAAVRIAEQLPDRSQPRHLMLASWNIVKSSGRDSRDYQRALQWAEEGSRLGPPTGWSLTFLGAALYRVGRFDDVLDAHDRAQPLPFSGAPREILPIFRAMTLYRLGRRDEARSQLGRLLRQFQERPWEFSWSRPLLREAQALIDPEPVGATTAAQPAHQDG
jgi:tetratricopeptide (TPR) repeat protein